MQTLTAEILPGRESLLGMDNNYQEGGMSENDGGRFEELRALDVVTPTAQSAALPVVVVVSLLLSVILLQMQGGGPIDLISMSDTAESSQASSTATAPAPPPSPGCRRTA